MIEWNNQIIQFFILATLKLCVILFYFLNSLSEKCEFVINKFEQDMINNHILNIILKKFDCFSDNGKDFFIYNEINFTYIFYLIHLFIIILMIGVIIFNMRILYLFE